MSEKIEEQVADSITLFNDFGQKGIEFVQEQSPQLCEEILARAIFQQFFMAVLCMLFVIGFFVLSRWFITQSEHESLTDDDKGTAQVCSILSGVIGIAFLFGAGHFLYSLISIIIAPKVYLVEYFIELIGN